MQIDDKLLNSIKNLDAKTMQTAIKMAGQIFGVDPQKAKEALSDPEKIKSVASAISQSDINSLEDLLINSKSQKSKATIEKIKEIIEE